MLARAVEQNVTRIVITAGSLDESIEAAVLAREINSWASTNAHDLRAGSTVGVHPTRANEIEDGGDEYLQALATVVTSNKDVVVAIGELGMHTF